MKLKMIKGRESSLIIENVIDSMKEDGFLASSYGKALRALCDYLKQTDLIRQELSKESRPSARNNILYRSPQNTIVLSGKRGSGKSSSMLSFSSTLEDPGQWGRLCEYSQLGREYSNLNNRRFVVIDPIDPTMLESNQSILSVILSRLLYIAESNWSQHLSFYGGFQDKESQKTGLLTMARRCLNGINAIKETGRVSRDLSDLQRVGDSSILKKNLYDFVELFLQFCSNTDTVSSESDHMLVLQVDDTDCQITQGYETMEDIRRYLTIPNVLILMATDTTLLRQVLSQHYANDFSSNLNVNLTKVEEIRHLGEKYFAKLMPPSNVVYLPNIDEMIRDGRGLLHIYYYDNDGVANLGGRNLLDPCREKPYEDYDFQSVILRYIYKKTHIVFASHGSYANNIIPTTLRGLAYLLGLLTSMKDVPEVDLNQEPFTADYLVSALKQQAAILEQNLNLFEEYFLHDWVQAKLPQDMADIIEKLSKQTPDQRVSFVMKEVATYYAVKSKELSQFPYTQVLDYSVATYADLDEQLRIIQGTHKLYSHVHFQQAEDFYFIFAIRTLLTIKNNKEILRIKHQATNTFKPDLGVPLVLDYLKGKTSLPTGFYLDETELYGHQLVSGKGIAASEYLASTHFDLAADKALFQRLYLDSNLLSAGVERRFNFTGGIIRWLAPEEDDYNGMDQKDIFVAQETAALMAANCDVQEAARKAVIRKARSGSAECAPVSKLSEAVQRGLFIVQDAIANINQEMLDIHKPCDSEKSTWKISSKLETAINAFQALKQEIDARRPYDRFDVIMPSQYGEYSNADFMEALQKYTDNLYKRIADKGKKIDKKTQAALDKLNKFEFKHSDGEITNGDMLNKLLEELYARLDELFSD